MNIVDKDFLNLNSKLNIKDILFAMNNTFFLSYYDELYDAENFQISYLKNADRGYYNCAHIFSDISKNDLLFIEKFFTDRKINSSVYIQESIHQNTRNLLLSEGYEVVDQELENWYYLDLDFLRDKTSENFLKINPKDFCYRLIDLNTSDLDDFIYIDSKENLLPHDISEKLKNNIILKKSDIINNYYFLGYFLNKPVSSRGIGICKDICILFDGATLSDHKKKGIYLAMICESLIFAKTKNCKYAFVNCDYDSISNYAFEKFGFEKIFSRNFYKKVM